MLKRARNDVVHRWYLMYDISEQGVPGQILRSMVTSIDPRTLSIVSPLVLVYNQWPQIIQLSLCRTFVQLRTQYRKPLILLYSQAPGRRVAGNQTRDTEVEPQLEVESSS